MGIFHRWQKWRQGLRQGYRQWWHGYYGRSIQQWLKLTVAFLCGLLLALNSVVATAIAVPARSDRSINQANQIKHLNQDGVQQDLGRVATDSHIAGSSIIQSALNYSLISFSRVTDSELLKNETKASADGFTYYQQGRYQEAIKFWQDSLQNTSALIPKIRLHCNLALAYRQVGQISQAIGQWQAALELLAEVPTDPANSSFDKDFDKVRQEAGILTEQGQLYSEIGQNQSAINVLEKALEITQKPEYASNLAYLMIGAAAQGSLGNIYGTLGNFDKAQSALESSLTKIKQLEAQNHPQWKLFRISTQNHLGNLLARRGSRLALQAYNASQEGDKPLADELSQRSEQDTQAALAVYQDNVNLSTTVGGFTEVHALLNYSRFLFSNSPPSADVVAQAHRYHAKIQQLLSNLPPSRDKIYSLIALADNINLWHGGLSRNGHKESDHNYRQTSISILESAAKMAEQIGDTRSESFAWGTLGTMSQADRKYDLAMAQTRRAMFLSQVAAAPDSLYRWQWQLGRILKQQGQYTAAITVYEQSIASLQTIRGDIIATNKEVQFNFRDSVEPVYRELIDLLLMASNGDQPKPDGKSTVKVEPSAKLAALSTAGVPLANIRKTLEILELLKLAELQNLFGDDCVQIESDRFESGTKARMKSALREDTAIIYSILLDNRTEMILRSGKDELRLYHVPAGVVEIQKEVNQLRGFLEKRSTDEYLPQVQKLYKLLIEPLEQDLAALQPKTLVFINDGVLRKIPMAALYDGKKFLIEKYAIATTPSLSLTSTKGLDRNRLRALTLGLTVERPPFAALPNVELELDAVGEVVQSTKLLDKEFTARELDKILRNDSYSIVHMATHGRFGVDAETTFLQTYDGKIGIDQLDNLLRSRHGQEAVDLLTLSACQTAVGDDRSALGIAGVAVRAGVRSALASLWFINDQATVPLIRSFYVNLSKKNLSKAEALQQAQIAMIQDPNLNHPAVWSSFILIGNWF